MGLQAGRLILASRAGASGPQGKVFEAELSTLVSGIPTPAHTMKDTLQGLKGTGHQREEQVWSGRTIKL